MSDAASSSGLAGLAALWSSPHTADVETRLAAISGSAAPIAQTPALKTSPAALQAAINETFTVEDLDLAAGEQSAILANSVPIVVDGRTRLKLTDAARGVLLGQISNAPLYALVLSAQLAADRRDASVIARDPARLASAWLRRFLAGEPSTFDGAPQHQLRAAAAALDSLRETKVTGLPSRAEIDRSLQFSELLEPLRILIGAEGGWGSHAYHDRFAGRARELRLLRQFVDGIASKSTLEGLQRGISRALPWRQRAQVLSIEAQGGLGKTALMARFMLDHALGQTGAPFPFAYIDFDRGAVEPREPRQLLMEVLRQVALQFPDLTGPLEELRGRVRMDLQGGISRSSDIYREFREALTPILGRRPFLLALDTLEVVQYDAAALLGLDRFLTNLIGDGFPPLRIVISGRAPLGEMEFLRVAIVLKPLRPKPLSVADASAMASALGRSILRNGVWKDHWSAQIAGTVDDGEQRREPLSIRVAVDTICGSAPQLQDAIAQEIESLGEDADESFVGRLYQKRILDHLHGEDVRRLAWPGLVVRNVTLEIVRQVLAARCGVPLPRVDAAFAELGREVWMVERRLEDGVEVLRHRRDLRARTLPLMRRHDPVLFAAINSAAIAHFARLAHEPRGRAEWLYHRLLAGEPLREIDGDWSSDLAAHLADAVDDFPWKDPAYGYLAARTTTRPVKIGVLQNMPDWVAFEYLANMPRAYGDLDDRVTQASLLDLAARDLDETVSRAATAARRTLMIKVGRWSEPDPDIEVGLPAWRVQARYAQAFRRARAPAAWNVLEWDIGPATTRDYRVLSQDLACAVQLGAPEAEVVDETLALALDELRLPAQRIHLPSLRIAGVFGKASYSAAARHWGAARSVQGGLLVASAAELRLIGASGLLETLEASDAAVLREWIDVAVLRGDAPGRASDPALSDVLRRLLVRAQVNAGRDHEPFVRRYLALSREDFVTPLAYCASRMLMDAEDHQLKEIQARVEAYALHTRTKILRIAAPEPLVWSTRSPKDLIGLLRMADEAGDLSGLCRRLGDLFPHSDASSDLAQLLRVERQWGKAIDQALDQALTASRDEPVNEPNRPPRPGPVKVEDDPQKGRWGGLAEHDGRRLHAVLVDTTSDSVFQVNLLVDAVDGKPLQGPVIFHLHSTFPRSVIHIRKIQDDRRAGLYDVVSYGGFTVGAQVRRADGQWTALELDLAQLPDLPKRFRDR